MRDDLVEILICPETHAPLELTHVDSFFDLAGHRHIVQGLLTSAGGSQYSYPILDEIPRLVPRRFINDEEKSYLEASDVARDDAGRFARRVVPEVFTKDDVEIRIRRHTERIYALDATSSVQARHRCESEIDYAIAESRGANKLKYVQLIAPYVERVDSLLETGGNFPGLTRSLCQQYSPLRAVVANLSFPFKMAFKTAEREIDAVRADVQALPFQAASFDLVASAFMLEHVPDWKAGLQCMLEVGGQVFIAFGPNKHFPFEIGHIDAPLAGTLPKPLAARFAWAWLALVGRRRSLQRIREMLDDVFHVSSRAFERECRFIGAKPRNLFPELVEIVIRDKNAPQTGPRKLLKTLPGLTTTAAEILSRLRLEPQMYYLIDGRQSE